MPRRQFMADLAKAQADPLPRGLADLKGGEDDGQVQFSFLGGVTPLADGPVLITAMVTDLGDYPKSHEYMLWSGEHAPKDIGDALGSVRGTNKKTVGEMLTIVSSALCRVQPDQDGDSQMLDGDHEDEYAEEDEDDVDIYGSGDDDDFDPDRPALAPVSTTTVPSATSAHTFRQRVREDLRVTKAAGFKVGHLGHLLAGISSYVAVSIRVVKLGISEEAMEAWQLQPNDYLTLLIQYQNGYKTNEELQGLQRVTPNLAMRVVAGCRYKPSLQEAINAFTNVRPAERNGVKVNGLPSADDTNSEESSIRDTFISKPLNDLLQDRFVEILKSHAQGMPWTGAERWYQERLDKAGPADNSGAVPDHCFLPEEISDSLPEICRADHYATTGIVQFSFPLLAMQFMLRHFVRCTEFCLTCHRKLATDVQAIKPYVCERPLCLFQYITYGLGPSIEHEMVAQPYVVDLLISFCYNSAAARKLKEFPVGLSIVVPPVDTARYNPMRAEYLPGRFDRNGVKATDINTSNDFDVHDVGFDKEKLELIFFNKPNKCPVSRGDWILLNSSAAQGQDLHCRVSDTTYFPTITIDPPVVVSQQQSTGAGMPGLPPAQPLQTPATTPAATNGAVPTTSSPQWTNATFQVYEQQFDRLDDQGKCVAICRLLDTLPTITDMKQFLLKRHPANLKHWTEHISPGALSLLRWIIASNRSCIMQVDGDDPTPQGNTPTASKAPTVFGKTQERCFGMKDYMQFRFAMGAPDKEQRFVTEVRNTTTRLSLAHPTIFAWHGSPLPNWHMIIREGLHFKNTDHGRAYGHGVYHAKDANTSTSYSGMYGGYGGVGGAPGSWPNSVLRISSALALNEIVNAPAEFVSQNPYYVVNQLDWIQTRYLFVQVAPKCDTIKIGADVAPTQPHVQDPARTPTVLEENCDDTPAGMQLPFKKFKLFSGNGVVNGPMVISDDDGDADSIATDIEDREILINEPAEPTPVPASNGKSSAKSALSIPKTDFIEKSLNYDTLPIMPEPTYATGAATNRLMKELRTLDKIQRSTPAAELGWFIDVEKIENVYQWIVELHSFHMFETDGEKLPLARDMKKHNVKSIVLEIRFNKDFPFTPPYVRVIRPQFLTLMQGGGGHIVAGGAMCMELLTNSGWSSILSMESVLMSIRLAITSEPWARLAPGASRIDYTAQGGAEGYIRACASHGWEVPPGFKEMAYNGEK
ncbi:Putative ubiquitin-conjugating enzyme E2, poly(ADP-ribose) polymerase, catalytic [Septoria linicola]|uniref:Ubiquitin-conjugating enzyme E2, poly(ADP-ribose) polymerase, catalytic n=1 Tax=Septoria linicola TaxID=215465 RepID=A0A9Q9AU28_9PEZI|nr:Putative ubiquitin-conjugating enzyme E2, poly(ADP-ribose) polymerase, catalytic [Septoria linicola]